MRSSKKKKKMKEKKKKKQETRNKRLEKKARISLSLGREYLDMFAIVDVAQ